MNRRSPGYVARTAIRKALRAKHFASCRRAARGKVGLEIGGPSSFFSADGLLPLYPAVAALDNCNYSGSTVWEGTIREGLTFQYAPDRAPGSQYIREATDLAGIADASYDLLLSCHTLEPSANPLLALSEWVRVLRPGGMLVMALPHKDGTFDHRRPVTTLEHLLADLQRNTREDDLTHMPEVLRLHDLERDPPAGNLENLQRRLEQNAENRCMHHHVFDAALTARILHVTGLQILSIDLISPCHIVAVARKPKEVGSKPSNRRFFATSALVSALSPFPTDRLPR
jgi:SAM-dependent methyltransferase